VLLSVFLLLNIYSLFVQGLPGPTGAPGEPGKPGDQVRMPYLFFYHRHLLKISICGIVMLLLILMTFFLSIGCSWRGWCCRCHWTKSEFLSVTKKIPNLHSMQISTNYYLIITLNKITLSCASLRVNVDSLVREEALALRVSRDQGDFQELPELMDLRSDPNHI